MSHQQQAGDPVSQQSLSPEELERLAKAVREQREGHRYLSASGGWALTPHACSCGHWCSSITAQAQHADEMQALAVVFELNECDASLRESLVRAREERDATCAWTYDDMADYWETGCDNAFVFTDGGPGENEMRFCPYCGKRLVVVSDTSEQKESTK